MCTDIKEILSSPFATSASHAGELLLTQWRAYYTSVSTNTSFCYKWRELVLQWDGFIQIFYLSQNSILNLNPILCLSVLSLQPPCLLIWLILPCLLSFSFVSDQLTDSLTVVFLLFCLLHSTTFHSVTRHDYSWTIWSTAACSILQSSCTHKNVTWCDCPFIFSLQT